MHFTRVQGLKKIIDDMIFIVAALQLHP